MSNQDEQARYNRSKYAAQIKENRVWQEGWTLIRATIVDKMQKVKASDVEEIMELKRTLDNLNRLERTFDRFIEDGKLIEKKRSGLLNFRN